MSQPEGAIPFSFFTSLITAISAIKPFQAGYKGNVPFYALDKFKAWRQYFLAHFPAPLPHTTCIIFCLLFPELDTYRKYHLKEAKLAQANSDEASRLSIHDIDDLLDELASLSPNSDASIHTKYPREMRRTRQEILRALFRRLNPSDAGILAQIVLKDLVPLLYPVCPSGYGAELRDYNTKSVKRLRVEDAMDVWDPSGRLRRLYRTHSDIRYATEAFERGEEEYKPQVGTRIKIPKSLKLQGIKNAFNTFSIRSSRVWVETKYDGERAQIHVQVETDGTSTITIFSKSGRNSTLDRIAVHWIVRQALGLRDPETGYPGRDDCKVKKNVVLDAEMVAWDTDHIDEFWRIRSLVERTATGARRRWRPSGAKERKADQSPHAGYSQSSLISDCDEDMTDDTHLALVFFDIMVLDDESLLGRPYSHRRSMLESVVELIPHYCLFSERYPVDLPRLLSSPSQEDSDSDDDHAPEDRRYVHMDITAQRTLERLYRIFARHLVDRREGIMIKADESRYDDWSSQWAKLKRDYIPGYGDTLDLVLVGAVWDAERARELGVSPAVYTTFYIGALTNAEALKKDPSVKPHYHVYFVSSYGLTRRQLEDLNSRIKARPTVLFADLTLPKPRNVPISHPELEYTFRLFEGLTKPHLVFCEPMLAEVFGAGFDVARGSKHYELRFPRISKIYNIEDRPHTACTTLHELADLAYAVVGRQSTKDEIDELWHRMNDESDIAANGKRKRGPTEDEWVELLRAADEGRLKPEQRKKRVKDCFARKPPPQEKARKTASPAANAKRGASSMDKVAGPSRFARHSSRRPMSTPPSIRTSFPDASLRDTVALPTPLTSPIRHAPEVIDSCSPPSSPVQVASSPPPDTQATPFLDFIQHAGAIYYDLARDHDEPSARYGDVLNETLKNSSAHVSPDLQDFLKCCGWMPDYTQPSGAQRVYGVVLSDVRGGAELESKDGWLKILHRLRFARSSLNEKGLAPARARLWIFDMDMLLYAGQDFLCKHLAEL
ncbi:hypothetical protein EV121DRAFT_292220 [Schizophyllum commune]